MNKKQNLNDSYKRNLFWTNFIVRFLLFYLKPKYKIDNFKRRQLPEGGNLILANHVTKLDQFFIGCYFYRNQIYYVAGENFFRNKLLRWFGEKALGLIIHQRGVTAISTINSMVKRLKEGRNVMIFPEGAMTFDGKTKSVDASIAKVARMSGANLVLFRISGGYFLQPRWGHSLNKGSVRLEHEIITKEQLRQMRPDEICSLINEKLYVNAYDDQENRKMRYIGHNPCEGLETCIYVCPSCNRISGLMAKGRTLYCDCGFSAEYDEYGYLTGTDGNVMTITRLCEEQIKRLRELLKDDELLFADELKCKKVFPNGNEEDVGDIKLSVYPKHVDCLINGETIRFENDRISSAFVFFRNTLNVVIDDGNFTYELTGHRSFNALKYRDFYDLIKEK